MNIYFTTYSFPFARFCQSIINFNASLLVINMSNNIAVWFFLAVPWVCLQFVIVVFPDHTLLLFIIFVNQFLNNYFEFTFTCNAESKAIIHINQ